MSLPTFRLSPFRGASLGDASLVFERSDHRGVRIRRPGDSEQQR